MPYTVLFSRRAEKDIKQVDERIAKTILNKLEWLASNAEDVVHRQLHGTELGRYFRLRAGDYRVVHEIRTESERLWFSVSLIEARSIANK